MKTAILITARLKSTRLAKKVTLPILGKPMISHMIDRLKLAERPEEIILCTSWVEQDDPLEQIAEQEGIQCFRDEPDDVLLRITHAAAHFGVDTVISCTADNPFVDPVFIDRLAGLHIENHNDYTSIKGLPLGIASYAVSFPAMVKACELKDKEDTENWGGYFTETGVFQTGTLEVAESWLRRPDIRLTVDTPEDFALVTKIFADLYRKESLFSLSEIVNHLNAHPELLQLNASVQQKDLIPIQLKEEEAQM